MSRPGGPWGCGANWERWRGAGEDSPVFPGPTGRPLTSRAVDKARAAYNRVAGIDPPATPLCLRHAFCKALVDAGESLDRVAALAGHADLHTTARYTRPTQADLQRAVSRLDPAP